MATSGSGDAVFFALRTALARAVLPATIPSCDWLEQNARHLWHERRSGFLRNGGALAGAGL